MRAIDLLFFVAEHDDHHLARVAELRAAFRARAVGPPFQKGPAGRTGAPLDEEESPPRAVRGTPG
jgi:hypothetical protein